MNIHKTNHKKRIIIIGKGSSGKNYLADILSKEFGISLSTIYTTRNLRKGEVNGKDYHFVDTKFFNNLDKMGEFQCTIHRKWFYGLHKTDWLTYKLFILTPVYLEQIPKKELDESIVIYVDTDEETIIKRLGRRRFIGCLDDQMRRFESDKKDFNNFQNYDIRLNTNYNTNELINQIKTFNINF